MSIQTKSSFIYGITVIESNNKIDFQEGLDVYVATLNTDSYNLDSFAVEIERAMNEIGSLDYQVDVDRTTRLITISADGSFDLLVDSGVNVGSSAFSLIGFTGLDRLGTDTYEANNQCGKEYRPQFILQSYTDFEDFQGKAFATVNKSASGIIEVVSFGSEQFMECNLTFITDIDQGQSDVIETDLNAVENVRDFLRYAITKGVLDFLPDRQDPVTFTKCILESTSTSKDGTAYRLKELYSRKLAEYYETGTLKFRRIL